MPKAEIISIGTELLLGDIVDTNAPFIAKLLRNYGIDIFYTSTIGDNPQRIAQTIKNALNRCDIVISTGGLGPTIDDPTREAASIAFNSQLSFDENSWNQIIDRFKKFDKFPTDNNKQQAYFPEIATPIENPVGTAPIFYVKSEENKLYIALPGVPSETEYLMKEKVVPLLKKEYNLNSVLVSKILHTYGLGESTLDMQISEFEKLQNPTVGLTAKIGQVDIRITAKAENENQAEKMIQEVEEKIREKIEKYIVGENNQDLKNLLIHKIKENKLKLGIIESGYNLKLINNFSMINDSISNAYYSNQHLDNKELKNKAIELLNKNDTNFVLATSLIKGNPNKINILFLTNSIDIIEEHEFQRPQEQVIDWAVYLCNKSLLGLSLN